MTDLTDSKTLWVVLHADSDALNRFLIFYFLGVLFPQRKLWTFWSLYHYSLGQGGSKFQHRADLKGESYDHKSFPKFKNFTLSRSKV